MIFPKLEGAVRVQTVDYPGWRRGSFWWNGNVPVTWIDGSYIKPEQILKIERMEEVKK